MTGFLDLPAELRCRVYELLVTHDQVIPISKPIGNPEDQGNETVLPRLPVLSAVNRQIRTEALALFYGSNTFTAYSIINTQEFVQRLDSRSLTMLRDIRATTYQLSAVQQMLKPKLEKLVSYHALGFLSRTAPKVPLRTKRIGRGGTDKNFEITWVSLAELNLWEKDPRDIDMVRRVTLLSGY